MNTKFSNSYCKLVARASASQRTLFCAELGAARRDARRAIHTPLPRRAVRRAAWRSELVAVTDKTNLGEMARKPRRRPLL